MKTGADTGGGALGARAPHVKKEEEKKGEREIKLVSYYNLNNEVFAMFQFQFQFYSPFSHFRKQILQTLSQVHTNIQYYFVSGLICIVL